MSDDGNPERFDDDTETALWKDATEHDVVSLHETNDTSLIADNDRFGTRDLALTC